MSAPTTSPSPSAADIRERVVSLIARVPESTVASCSAAQPLAVPGPGGHVVLVTTTARATTAAANVRLEFGGDVRRLRAFCAGCLSRSCGHALRVLAVFRAAVEEDWILMTRLLVAEGPDAIADEELTRRWEARESARADALAATRREALATERAAEARARSQARAQGADLPLFAA